MNSSKAINIALIVVSISVLSPVIGLTVEFLYPHSMAFSRSGCVMVACSLALIYLNHFFVADAIAQKELSDAVQKLSQFELDKIKMIIPGLSATSRELFSKFHVEEILKQKLPLKKRSEALKRLSGKVIVGAEFAIGIVGTLIWGFGDLSFMKRTIFIALIPLFYLLFKMYQAYINVNE